MCYNIKREVAIPPGFEKILRSAQNDSGAECCHPGWIEESEPGGIAMIAGIGLDLCEIERMKKAIERPRFVDRVFTTAETERIRAASDIRRGEIAAGLFAAKEAVSKALGTGLVGISLSDIEIIPDAAGCPRCALSGKAHDRARALCGGGYTAWVSITHENGMAAATAILETE